MRKSLLILILVLAGFSCKKDVYKDADEPEWLKLRISTDEEMINSHPELGFDKAAWIRYEWLSAYFYDYINLNNSSGPETYTYQGDQVSFSAQELETYHTERCCEHVVWTGGGYY